MTDHTDAGREMDRQIAEMLGWHSFEPADIDGDDEILGVTPDPYVLIVPHYSTDLNAALGLLAENGVTWELKGLAPAMITCDIWLHGWHKAHEMGNTPALAICRAWLAYQRAGQPGGEGA